MDSIQAIAELTPRELSRLADKVGNTSIQPIRLSIKGRARTIYCKLEGENPTGSMKDRTGYALLKYLIAQGRLHAESIIIESTSGNLGVALAFQCKARGYRFVAVVDPKTTRENIAKMSLFGARIDLVEQADENNGYLLSRLARIQELCSISPEYVWTNQYESLANPYIHYVSTGPEIYRQMDGMVDALFIPVSTGGTLAGVGRFFRESSPLTQIIGVDAYGSVIFGTPPGPRKLTGIGASRPSSFLSPRLYDAYRLVEDEEAFAYCRALASSVGLHVGGSSGATFAACVRYLAENPDITRAVCVCADRGENYASSIFSDTWLQQQELYLPDISLHLEPLTASATPR